jgi:predicted O-methyltransferase YrrM
MRKSIPKSYEYIKKLLPAETNLMFQARENSKKLGLDTISMTQAEAAIMKFYLKEIKAQKVLEIGTLTGLSALHFLEVLPTSGCLYTIEKTEKHADMAQEVLEKDIQAGRCKLIVGDAREKLKELTLEAPFDAIFIDGNKAAYLDYFDWAVENIKLGGIIFVDNIFLAGAVWGDSTTQKFNPKQIGVVQTMNQKAFDSKFLQSVIIPTEEGLLISKKITL